jgi:hypothetical protein
MLVVLSVPFTLLATCVTGDRTGLNRRAEHPDIERGLAGGNAACDATRVGAIQVEANAMDQVLHTRPGRLGDGPGVSEVAEAARAAPVSEQPRAIDLLLDGLATRFVEGYSASLPPLREALRELRGVQELTEREMRWLGLGCRLAQDLWDDELWYVLATGGLRVARETGAVSVLPLAATYRAALHVQAGEFGLASALIAEADAITQATGMAPLKYASLMLIAWRGNEAEGLELIEAARFEGKARGEGMGLRALRGSQRSSSTAVAATTRHSTPPSEGPSKTTSGCSGGHSWS